MAIAVAIGSVENGTLHGTSAPGICPRPVRTSGRLAHPVAALFSRPFGRYLIGVLTRRKRHSPLHRRSFGPSLQRWPLRTRAGHGDSTDAIHKS